MVVVSPTTPNVKVTPNLRSQSNSRRPPLLPSERDNSNNKNVAVTGNCNRLSKSREVNSRYLSTSSSSSTSGSSSSTVSNSSYFSSSSRRCPSPIPPKTTNSSVPATPLLNSKRSQSAERRRPSTPKVRGEKIHGEMSAAAKMLMSSSKSLSVSFQGGSFAVPPSSKKMAKNFPSPSPLPSPSTVASLRKGAPEMRQSSSRTTPWPGRSRSHSSVSSLSRSVDLGGCEGRKSVTGSSTKVVRALQESLIGDCTVKGSVSKDGIVNGIRDDNESCVNGSSLGSESVVSDRESVLSESNSGSQDGSNGEGVGHRKGGGRILVVPSKYWQEANSSVGSPLARSSSLKGTVPPKLFPSKRLVSDSTGASPRETGSNRGISSPRSGYGLSSSSQSGASLRSFSPSKMGSSMRPASPSNIRASLRSSSPSKNGASLRPVTSMGASLRPASPCKTGASLRPSSPSKSGASLRPSSPSKMGESLRPASQSLTGLSLRSSSSSKMGVSSRPTSQGPTRSSMRPAPPSTKAGSLRSASPSKVGASLRPSSPSNVGKSLRPASPNRIGISIVSEKANPSGGMGRMASPSRVRNAIAGACADTVTGMPSVLCFGADVRRVRVGDNRLGDVHLLRILHNRHLQWRFVNARAESSLCIQQFNAERTLSNAWKTTSDLREMVSAKRIELQMLKQNLKLVSILKGQLFYLEEWATMVKDHCSSLSGAMESLKASTIRLPLIWGAKADIQDLKDAICSAADVMHAMASSIRSLLEKVEEVNSLVAEVASITSKEQFFLSECKDIVSLLAAMQVHASLISREFVKSSLKIQVERVSMTVL